MKDEKDEELQKMLEENERRAKFGGGRYGIAPLGVTGQVPGDNAIMEAAIAISLSRPVPSLEEIWSSTSLLTALGLKEEDK